MQHKLITITGPDMCGKATQAQILMDMIASQYGGCHKFEFPDYSTPMGKLMGAMLDDSTISITSPTYKNHPGPIRPVCLNPNLRDGDFLGKMPSIKDHPMVYHDLLTANYHYAQEAICEALEDSHVVCDRYGDVEDLVFCKIDCRDYFKEKIEIPYRVTSPDNFIDVKIHNWVLDSRIGIKRSDFVILLDAKGYPRPGETQDEYEKNAEFQAKIRELYLKVAEDLGWIIIKCDDVVRESYLKGSTTRQKIETISWHICNELTQRGFKLLFDNAVVEEVCDSLNVKGCDHTAADECTCPCHGYPNMMHIVACCHECKECGRMIGHR